MRRLLQASSSPTDDDTGRGRIPDGATGSPGAARQRSGDGPGGAGGANAGAAGRDGAVFLGRDPHDDAEFLLLVAGSLLSILAALAFAMLL